MHGPPYQDDVDSAAKSPQDQALVAKPATPGRLGRQSSEHHLRVGIRPIEYGLHNWPVSGILDFLKLVQVTLTLLALAPLYIVAAIGVNSRRIRARDRNSQRRQTARENRRGECVRKTERWNRGDESDGQT